LFVALRSFTTTPTLLYFLLVEIGHRGRNPAGDLDKTEQSRGFDGPLNRP